MKKDVTTIQIFKPDLQKIRQLTEALERDMGSFVSQRMAIMLAVNRLLRGTKRKALRENERKANKK